MVYEIGKSYKDRTGKIYLRIDHWNNLPTFSNETGKLYVRNFNGRYRWDEKQDERDILE